MDREIGMEGGPHDGNTTAYSGDGPAQGDVYPVPGASGQQWSKYVYDKEKDKYVFSKLCTPAEAGCVPITENECKGK